MIKRSFMGLFKPTLQNDMLEGSMVEPEVVPDASTIYLFIPNATRRNAPQVLKAGDTVTKGQRLLPCENSVEGIVSPVSGSITATEPFVGNFGCTYDKLTISVSPDGIADDNCGKLKEEPSVDTLTTLLSSIPGELPVSELANDQAKINSIVINGADEDLLVVTRQSVIKTRIEDIKEGVKIIKKALNVANITLVVPEHLKSAVSTIGMNIKVVSQDYPSANPKLVMKNQMGTVVPAGKTCADQGVCFISPEAVANVGLAFKTGELPTRKTITVIKKDGSKQLVSAQIGTPVKDVLSKASQTVGDRDRLIFGGPMKGSAIYSLDHPVMCDTDAVIVQDAMEIPEVSDSPCINCGECVRICPANVPVNLMIRFLEAGQYEEAQIMYDLDSCIECGLCSYVCVSKMPVFQYITLAKHELAQIRTAEANND